MNPEVRPQEASLIANVEQLLASIPPDSPMLPDDAICGQSLFHCLLRDLEQTGDGGLDDLAVSVSRVGDRVRHARLEALLGRGGMGEVYLAFDEVLHRQVAIKVLRVGGTFDDQAGVRLLREARSLARLDHPGICRVYDVVEEGSERYLVLELITGELLGVASARLSFSGKLRVVAEIAEALAVAHEAGITHRDLKPDNVMLQPDGRARVMDFGIARWKEEIPDTVTNPECHEYGDSRQCGTSPAADWLGKLPWVEETGPLSLLTRKGSILGTIRYMSPEQALGEVVTTSSDVYSLGLILHELLSEAELYPETDSAIELLRIVAEGKVQSPAGIKNQRIRGLIDRCTAPNPTDRPSAEDVAFRLRDELSLPQRRRRWFILTAAAAVIVTILGLTFGNRLIESRRIEMAQQWNEDVRWMEEQLRYSYTAPLHNVRKEVEQVNARLKLLEGEVQQTGWLGRPPGLAALGQAHLVLNEYDDAVRLFKEAWESGNRSPQVALSRGTALGWIYSQRYMDAELAASVAEREIQRQKAQREFRNPALKFLVLGQDVEVESPEYIEAIMAMIEGRLDDALKAARMANEKIPWLYQAKILEGRILAQKGEEFGGDGDNAAAERAFAEAEKAYEDARKVGRSDPDAFSYHCTLKVFALRFASGWGQEVDPMVEKALEVCGQAVTVNPDNALNHGLIGDVLMQKAYRRQSSGMSTAGILEESLASLNRAITLAPQAAYLERKGLVLTMIASDRNNHGLPAMAEVDEALVCFADARKLAPIRTTIYINSTWPSMIKADLLRDAGKDPEPATIAAEEALAAAMGFGVNEEGLVAIAANVASVWRGVAEARFLGGGDTSKALARASELFTMALKSPRRTMPTLFNAADFCLLTALVAYRDGDDEENYLQDAEKLAYEAIDMGPAEFPHFALAGADLLRARVALRDGLDPDQYLVDAHAHVDVALEIGEAGVMTHIRGAQVDLYRALARQTRGTKGTAELASGLDQMEKALEIDRNLGISHAIKGLLLYAGGQNGPAHESFAEARRLNPGLDFWLTESLNEVRRLHR